MVRESPRAGAAVSVDLTFLLLLLDFHPLFPVALGQTQALAAANGAN